MRRRDFVTSCASGMVAATVVGVTAGVTTRSFAQTSEKDKAVAALSAARQLEVSGNFDQLKKAFHSDAMHVDPSSLQPNLGRAAILDSKRAVAAEQKLLYFYYRQPMVVRAGNSAVVVSNYEAGYDVGGKVVEDTGKSSSIVLMGSDPPLIALDMIVPNLYSGSYGARGTALAPPHFGLYPLRALGQEAATEAVSAGGGESDVLYSQVRKVNSTWVSGDANALLKMANPSSLSLVGDYSPYYITGSDAIKEHFADFYKTAKVNFVRSIDPAVRIWGDSSAVYFNFDLSYVVNGKNLRSPGRGVYVFTKSGGAGASVLAHCAASHLVLRGIGDPYPTSPG
jgi:hypothetical protein